MAAGRRQEENSMNPYIKEIQAPLLLAARACGQCRDMGYVLPPEFASDETDIPAGVLFRYGRPCACGTGSNFARQQQQWNQPERRASQYDR